MLIYSMLVELGNQYDAGALEQLDSKTIDGETAIIKRATRDERRETRDARTSS